MFFFLPVNIILIQPNYFNSQIWCQNASIQMWQEKKKFPALILAVCWVSDLQLLRWRCDHQIDATDRQHRRNDERALPLVANQVTHFKLCCSSVAAHLTQAFQAGYITFYTVTSQPASQPVSVSVSRGELQFAVCVVRSQSSTLGFFCSAANT